MKKIGMQQYINVNTGERINAQVFELEEKDAKLENLWEGYIFGVLQLLGGKKIEVFMYILENKNSDNLVLGTQRKIAKEIGISYPVVNETFNILQESGFLNQERQGAYRIPSNFLFKGSKVNRANVLYKYKN